MSSPLVTVVIPLHNKENFIQETIESVVAQSYKEIELVIIDDASSDSSVDVATNSLRFYQGRFSRVVIASTPNTGQTVARNEGIALASGEFVAFLDADDIWHSEKIEKQVKFLVKHKNVDLVLCDYLMFYQNRSFVRAIRFLPVEKKILSWLLTTGFGGLLESTGLARRTALLSMAGFTSNLQMCGGLDLAFRFSSEENIGCVGEYLCAYRVTEQGWHNNKKDLVDSYNSLLLNDDLYGRFEKQIRRNLDLHLKLWSFRHSRDLKTFINLAFTSCKRPVSSFVYIALTGLRVFTAILRGSLFKRSSPLFWNERTVE